MEEQDVFVLVFLAIALIVYINCFKDDFTNEHLDKLKPVVYIAISLAVVGILLTLAGV